MHIHIIWIGKTKEKQYLKIIQEFEKRISGFAKLEITELKSENLEPEVLKVRQAQLLSEYLKKDIKYFFLDEAGAQYTSPKFSDMIEKTTCQTGKIGFVIGGVYGFSKEIKKAKTLLSFSQFTFTHQMIRCLLLEQVYRALCIMNNKKYHY